MAKVIADKKIGRFRVIGVEYSEEEVKRLLPEAEKEVREFIEDVYQGEVPEDAYVGTPREVAIGQILAGKLSEVLHAPFIDCTPHEEAGYGLPEFSVYWNWDARSWCGKWTYSDSGMPLDECGVFWLLCGSDEEEYGDLQDYVGELTNRRNVAVAIIKE